MDPINPWIDPSETRRMAERLMQPAREPVSAPDETGFDECFVGFSELSEVDAEIVAPAPVEAVNAWETIEAEPVPDAAEGSSVFSEQRAILRERFNAVASFMLDSQGALVFNEGKFGMFHFVARELAKIDAKPQPLRIKVGATSMLEMIPIGSEGGYCWLGVVLPTLLPQDASGQIHLHWLGAQ